MPIIEITTLVNAPVERVFDLARSIELHTASTSGTQEQAIAGVTSGLINAGDEVTWRARHFGVWQKLTVKITGFHRTTHFRDVIVRGAFKSMAHDHYFEPDAQGTRLRDVFDFESPFGIFGRIADRLFLKRYMQSFVVERNQMLKAIAESDEWRRYLTAG